MAADAPLSDIEMAGRSESLTVTLLLPTTSLRSQCSPQDEIRSTIKLPVNERDVNESVSKNRHQHNTDGELLFCLRDDSRCLVVQSMPIEGFCSVPDGLNLHPIAPQLFF